jgi:Peptidase family M23
MIRSLMSLAAFVLVTGVVHSAAAETFTHEPPGKLVPGSGTGREDSKVYAPDMRFPMETGPAYANSQVWGHGGNSGPKNTSQCDEENFSYPWHDNYCESRSWDMPLCPSGTGHQGQDIRAATCEKDVHWVVAVVDGTITNVGSYSVYLTAADGTRYDYLHMSNVQVKEGDSVKKGERVGKVSNQFGGEATTVHLHFNIRQNVNGVGSVYVPGYMSLVGAYDRLLNPTPPVPDAGPAKPPEEPEPARPTEPAATPLPEAPPASSANDSGCASTSGTSPSGAYALGVAALTFGSILRRRRTARR